MMVKAIVATVLLLLTAGVVSELQKSLKVTVESCLAEVSTRRRQPKMKGFGNATDAQVLEAVEFLLKFAPAKDLSTLSVGHFVDNVEAAFDARGRFPWGKSMPWNIFLNDVLPYAMIDEHRENWRPMFLKHFSTYKELYNKSWTTHDAVLFMNKVAWQIVNPPIKYRDAPADEVFPYSPFRVMANHYASCTGLSVFFSAALRSIGIPIRVAGTAHWNRGPKACPHGDASDDCGNHDWPEVWTNGGWSFDGINGGFNATYNVLNTSWFFPEPAAKQVFGVRNHSINAASWAPAEYLQRTYGGAVDDPLAAPESHFPMVWNWTVTTVPAWDVTKRYLSLLPK